MSCSLTLRLRLTIPPHRPAQCPHPASHSLCGTWQLLLLSFLFKKNKPFSTSWPAEQRREGGARAEDKLPTCPWPLSSSLRGSSDFPAKLISEESYRETFGTRSGGGESQGKCELSTSRSAGPLSPQGDWPDRPTGDRPQRKLIARSQRRKRAWSTSTPACPLPPRGATPSGSGIHWASFLQVAGDVL